MSASALYTYTTQAVQTKRDEAEANRDNKPKSWQKKRESEKSEMYGLQIRPHQYSYHVKRHCSLKKSIC